MPPLSLLFRTWRRHWVTLVVWTGFCLLVGIYNLVLYPYLVSLPEYSRYLSGLPQWLRFLEGQPGQLDTATALLFLSTFGFSSPFIWLLLILRVGVNETAGEEEQGSLIFLLTHPIQRRTLYLAKVLAIGVMVFLMGFVLWASTAVMIVIDKVPIGLDWLGVVVLNLGLFVFWCGTVAMLVGALTGKQDFSTLLTALFILVVWAVEGITRLGILPISAHWVNPWGLVLISFTEKNTTAPWWTWSVIAGLCLLTSASGAIAWHRRNFSSYRGNNF